MKKETTMPVVQNTIHVFEKLVNIGNWGIVVRISEIIAVNRYQPVGDFADFGWCC